MSEDDFKTQIALLTFQIATLEEKIRRIESDSNKRHDKSEATYTWIGRIIAAAIVAQVLASAGIGL